MSESTNVTEPGGDALEAPERRLAGQREVELVDAPADLAAEVLPEQILRVGLVINHQDVGHVDLPGATGSETTNAVWLPGSLSTDSLPPCCFTTIS